MSDEVWLVPVWDTFEKIEAARAAVEWLYAQGGLSREERAVARGNLAEAEAKLRLRQRRPGGENGFEPWPLP